MTRLLLFLVHNWPLKLAAVVLATLLYGVIVITQDSRQIAGPVQIKAENPPSDVVIVSNLGEVQDIRYLADDVPVNASTFRAFVDFQGVTARTGSVVLPVTVESNDPRVTPIGWEPRRINIELDELVTRGGVPVLVVQEGEVPDGFDVRDPERDPETVEVRGASADVARVDRVEAHVQIQGTSLDINRELDLTPVDARGEPIPEVDVVPSTVRVRIAILEDGVRKSVPVRPDVTGDPAPGFEVVGVDVDPDIVTIEGDGEQVAATGRADTQPISLTGATESFERTVALVLPDDVLAVGSNEVRVRVTLRAVSETRTFTAGVVLDGARADRTYTLSAPSVLVIVGGAPSDLDRLEGRTFTVEAPVAGLEDGRHEVPLNAALPAGLGLVTITPPAITVTISTPEASAPAGAAP